MRWFEIGLVLLTAFTGLVWLLDKLLLAKRRAARQGLLDEGKEPIVVDYSKAFFPVLAIVLILRSFVAEPFRIPSNSMMPTLLTGDFILVNKFDYGLRLPITNQKFVSIGEPQRGDVVVFQAAATIPNQDWIKRVVGLPGDRIAYHDNQVFRERPAAGLPDARRLPGQGQWRGDDRSRGTAREPARSPHHVLERTDLPFIDQGEGEWDGAAGSLFRDGRQSR